MFDNAARRARDNALLVAFREREAMGLPKRAYKCLACGEPGHNRRTCPVVNYGPEPLWVRAMRAAGRPFKMPDRRVRP